MRAVNSKKTLFWNCNCKLSETFLKCYNGDIHRFWCKIKYFVCREDACLNKFQNVKCCLVLSSLLCQTANLVEYVTYFVRFAYQYLHQINKMSWNPISKIINFQIFNLMLFHRFAECCCMLIGTSFRETHDWINFLAWFIDLVTYFSILLKSQ